jgi:hypothetical protein
MCLPQGGRQQSPNKGTPTHGTARLCMAAHVYMRMHMHRHTQMYAHACAYTHTCHLRSRCVGRNRPTCCTCSASAHVLQVPVGKQRPHALWIRQLLMGCHDCTQGAELWMQQPVNKGFTSLTPSEMTWQPT